MISYGKNPNETSTVDEFISYKDTESVSYHNMSFRDKYGNISYPIKNIIDDYIDELKEIVVEVELTDKEYFKYRYRPRLLAHDIYQNPDFDFIILAVNGICNMKEFDSRTIKLCKVDELNEFLTAIFNANKDDIDIYNSISNA